MSGDAVRGYAACSRDLIAQWAALEPASVLSPVADMLPTRPGQALDVGAGTGGVASWFARRGWEVTAVEPVAAFRAEIKRHSDGHNVRVVDDRLPDLADVPAPVKNGGFDLLLVLGVLHHLCPEDRRAALSRLRDLMSAGATLVLALRHGPSPANRPAYLVSPDDLFMSARDMGCEVAAVRRAASRQPGNRAAGVTWDWVVLKAA